MTDVEISEAFWQRLRGCDVSTIAIDDNRHSIVLESVGTLETVYVGVEDMHFLLVDVHVSPSYTSCWKNIVPFLLLFRYNIV